MGNQIVPQAGAHAQFGYHLEGLNPNHDLWYVSPELSLRSHNQSSVCVCYFFLDQFSIISAKTMNPKSQVIEEKGVLR